MTDRVVNVFVCHVKFAGESLTSLRLNIGNTAADETHQALIFSPDGNSYHGMGASPATAMLNAARNWEKATIVGSSERASVGAVHEEQPDIPVAEGAGGEPLSRHGDGKGLASAVGDDDDPPANAR